METIPSAGATIENQTIEGFDWGEADLTDAIFNNCLIADAQFGGVTLEGARFNRCRILRGRFARADLRDTLFGDCNFADPEAHAGLSLAYSRLDQAVFRRCDLSFSKIESCELHGLTLEDCNLRGAQFRRNDFTRNLGRYRSSAAATLRRCNLHLADLSDISLPGCDLAQSLFREADLSGANLEGADLRDTDLFGAITSGAKLAGADLRGGELSGLDLTALASRDGLKITADQQYALLSALGIDVTAD